MRTTFLIFGIPLFVLCTLLGSGKACGQSEYRSAAGECCPMCNIGSVVHKDCIGDLSTSCKPCAPGTFMNEPNGLHNCFICRNCAASQGLYIQRKCNTIENTVCDVLDGYHCIEFSGSECTHAVKHSVCEPGQETKTPGTKSSDTVCVDCTHGFYSPSGLNCIQWTDCKVRNEIQIEDGSSVKDVTCASKTRGRYGLIPLVVFPLVFSIFFPWYRSQNLTIPTEETNALNTPQSTSSKPEENRE